MGVFVMLGVFVGNNGINKGLGKRVDVDVDILKSFANESANVGSCFSSHFKTSSFEIGFVFERIFGGNVEAILFNRFEGGNVDNGMEVTVGIVILGSTESFNFSSGFTDNAAGFVSSSISYIFVAIESMICSCNNPSSSLSSLLEC